MRRIEPGVSLEKEGEMRILLIAVLAGALFGCQTGPSGRWVQAGRTDLEAQADYGHCEKVAMQESEGMRSTDPFKETSIKESCMKRMGYEYVRNK